MYDVGKLARGAREAYNLAPSPATFLTLVTAAHATLTELRNDFAKLPSGLQVKHEKWAKDAAAYDARLNAEYAQARKIVDLIKDGNMDWQAGLAAGSEYAKALKKFFVLGDSSLWASLANRLSEIKLEQRPESFIQRPWLLELWMPWTAAQNLIVEELAESAATTEMGQNTGAALGKVFDDGKKFVGKAAAGFGAVAAVALLAIGALFFLKD